MSGQLQTEFGGGQVAIETADGQLLDIGRRLADPADYHGDTNVNYLVRFGNLFAPLIGKFPAAQTVEDKRTVVLEIHYDSAKKLMADINDLAQRLIAKPQLYEDASFCGDYFALAKSGYGLLAKHQTEFKIPDGLPVSLERAGLVTTRLAMGLGQDAKINDEIRVVTKRTHIKGEPPSYLTASVKWRHPSQVKLLNKSSIVLNDFVNPASGASTAAFVLAAQAQGAKPKILIHRSINATMQGITFMRRALSDLGIEPYFYSVGSADTLDHHYYLAGRRAVGDAGHALRHFLPNWYKP